MSGWTTAADWSKLAEIARLHDEASWALMEEFDGHCKSSEGRITVVLTDSFERRDHSQGLAVQEVGVYAYVVGPSRHHWFDSIDEALSEVRRWHSEAMEWVEREKREAGS